MNPFSQFEVEEVQVQEGQAVKVNLREIPLPRQTNVILWVDDQPKNNYHYAQKLELENQDVSVVFQGSHFRIVTDMVRDENGKLNYLAGIDLLVYLFKEINYKKEVDQEVRGQTQIFQEIIFEIKNGPKIQKQNQRAVCQWKIFNFERCCIGSNKNDRLNQSALN